MNTSAHQNRRGDHPADEKRIPSPLPGGDRSPPQRRRLVALLGLLGGLAQGCGGDGAEEQQASLANVRSYFIAADEGEWDYAPAGKNLITNKPFGDEENVFVERGPNRIGRVYKKALFHEYTDATFTTRKPVAPQWQHLGIMGPLIRGVVGDTLLVTFRNNTKRRISLHPHGVFYNKDAEGAPYADGVRHHGDGRVPPGGTYVYSWGVPERAGPGPADGSSVPWMYHSHTDEIGDTYAGLIGPMVVTAKGKAKADGSPIDVDRELVNLFQVWNENLSPYLQDNIDAFAGDPSSVDPEDEDFQESNLMHAINGYVYGNMPGLTMQAGQRVRWYLIGMGTEVDLHTAHWHGNTTLVNGHRTDVVELLPASMRVADMVPDSRGTWLYHCHVNDHIAAGMIGLYTVE